jgi:site-specific DNA recombinase
MTRCICYARYSPRPDEATSTSAEKQLADLRAFARKQGWTVAEEYTDLGISGHDWKRDGLWDAIRALEPESVLLAYNADRLARDTGILAFIVHQVQARGATIHTLEAGPVNPSDPISKFMFKMLGAFAELQRELFARRSRNGFARNLAAGRYKGNRLPYGYRWVSKAAGTVEPDPEEQDVVGLIQTMATAGSNRNEIAAELNEQGFTWRGKPWTRFHVRNVLGDHKRGSKKVKMPRM